MSNVRGWITVSDLPDTSLSDMGLAQDAVDYSNYVLWSLTGRRYSAVTVTTESYDTRHTLLAGRDIRPVLRDGSFYNDSFSTCRSCVCSGCGVRHRMRLRGYPVQHIIDVWVSGCRLERDDYAVIDNSVLGLWNPRACNAACVTVEYSYGTGVPPGGKLAAVRLATELIAARQGEQCQLPERVTSVSRQGMSWTLLDPQEFLKDSRTGIYEIDLLLQALNPAKALARPRVFSPDLRRASAFNAAEPPPSLALHDGDQMIVPGAPIRWVVSDPRLVSAVRRGASIDTKFSDGHVKTGGWVLSSDKHSAHIDFSESDTSGLGSNLEYQIVEGASILVSGTVRSFTS